MTPIDRKTVDAWFRILAERLKTHPLPTEAGGTRTAEADEFMLMHEQPSPDGRIVGFKHRDTRNYVFLIACRGEVTLYVPVTDQPFRRGFFDLFAFTPEGV